MSAMNANTFCKNAPLPIRNASVIHIIVKEKPKLYLASY